MALIACPECSRDVSESAISCPQCGHPIAKMAAQAASSSATAAGVASKSLFEVGKAKFVLDEIAALSSQKTRNWVYLVIGAPAIIAAIFAWLNQGGLVAVGVTVLSFIVLAMIHVDQGRLATTGKVSKFEEDMAALTERYREQSNVSNLIEYHGRNLFLDMQFSINPARVAEFKRVSTFDHIWWYVLAALVAGAGYYLALSWCYGLAGGLAVLGFLSRKAALEVVGVGGANLHLYTKAGDAKAIANKLSEAIEVDA